MAGTTTVDNKTADKAMDDALAGLGITDADSRPRDDSDVADTRELGDGKPKDEADTEAKDADTKDGQPEGQTDQDRAAAKDEASEGPDLSQLQQRTAEQFGIDADTLAAWGEKAPEILDSMGKQWSRKMSELGRKAQERQTGKDRGQANAQEDKADAKDDGDADDRTRDDRGRYAKRDSEADADGKDLPNMTAEDVFAEDPAKHNQHRAYTRALAQRVAQLEQFVARETTERTQRVDQDFFKGLTKDYPDFTPDGKKAAKVAQEADLIMAGFHAHGMKIDRNEALERAWSYLGMDAIRETERARVRTAQESRRNQRTFRPSTRTGTRQSSREQAENDRLDDAARRLLGHALPD